MTLTVLKIDTDLEIGNERIVSQPLGQITTFMFGIPEYDSRWVEQNGFYGLREDSDQDELLPLEPLFYMCPRRGEGHYVLTSQGEAIVESRKKSKLSIEDHQDNLAKRVANVVTLFPENK